MTPLERVSCLAVAALALAGPPAAGRQAPPCERPLTLQYFDDALKHDVPSAVLEQRMSACGVTFILDADGERRLRAAGATSRLIGLLSAPTPAAGQSWTPPIDRRRMVGIGAGTFQMGSPATEPGRDDDEQLHTVDIPRAFWLDVTDVTYEAFGRFLAQNPEWTKDRVDRKYADSRYLSDWSGTRYPSASANRPVAWVSWHAAAAYAAWAGKRLPTEAEWEYACRAGTTTTYWWGQAFDPGRANNGGEALPVDGEPRRNPWGLYDMLGNVWQWTSSLYEPYPYRRDAREDANGTGNRSVRGGSWGKGEAFLRSANRNSVGPTVTSGQVGFRCAR